MADNTSGPDFSQVEARRSAASQRRLSPGRRLYYFLGQPLLFGAIKLLCWSYRVEKLVGREIAERLIEEQTVCTPCYWHQHLLLGNNLIRAWIARGFRAAFLISASVDGDVPARIARRWGAEVIRGSANNTGALVLRDMQQMTRRGVSVVSIADGPTGPQSVFKSGVVLMARIAAIPMVPIGCAADRAWHLRRWDDFMIPKPFARIVIAIGEPHVVPPDTPLRELEPYRLRMENAVKALTERSKAELEADSD
ncbi:MAG: hypothetical protein BMS9Abin32_540 [Gammaproteobacteria bacterium]|nr:MAG: hypothetical protein BMS9Abin32_540 [Gammaproteobacteria bacterium]